jgi:N-acyl-D-aspartate/D-glutamate deacylase
MSKKIVDVLIQNARVHDGERFLPDQTDVGISCGTLVLLRPGEHVDADEVIDAGYEGRVHRPVCWSRL